ncbi:hypothetical protein G8759_31240 [Spirosoma aureum]|uniref:Uncharacterized protein n=1 Tax=Spirosoma aureum TaxID=2692134 RepID=A0A6G9AWT7_9BACT|nr:hypothetical protein [Spirosoma aureum]QIP16799.1 hypothetical protein G8759_31240 [Spirosoma aureum]
MLNYTTKIEAAKTVGEIQQTLSKNGVRKIVVDYDSEGNPIALTFVIDWNNIPTLYALPCRWEGVLKVLNRSPKVTKANRTKEQALRVAWRILKDWIEAQLAITEAELASVPEVFLPYLVTSTGDTLYSRAIADQRLLPLP